MRPFASRQRNDLIVIGVYLVLAIALTYPLALHLTTHVPGRGTDDPALTWNLWWMKYALFDLGAMPLYSSYIFYPIGVNLVAYTATFLNGVLALPLVLAFGVIPAQNLYVLGALVLGGYGAFLLSREILSRLHSEGGLSSDLAAGLAGAFYAFGAWHLSYVAAGHFMLLSNQWLPLFALMLLRLERTRTRVRDGALAGLFFVCAAWTELTFVPFVTLLTAFYLLYLILARRRAFSRVWFTNFAAYVVVVVLGVAPLGWSLLQDTLRYGYYLAPGLGRVQIFSAELISFFLPSFQHPLLGAWSNAITTANTSYAFIGWAALVLALVGLIVARHLPDARFLGLLALFFALVLLGPTLSVNGSSTGIPLPFALLRELPFVNANRYPVRFNVMLMLGLTPLVALGAAALMQRQWGRVALGALTTLLLFEQLVLPLPLSDLRAGRVFEEIRAERGDFTVLDLPLGWRNSVEIQGALDFKAQFLQTIHQKRLLGGLTSRNPRFKFQYFRELPILNALIALETGGSPDEAQEARDRELAQEVIRFFDIRYVEAQKELTPAAVLEYLHRVLPLTEIYSDAERVVYRVAQAPPVKQASINPASDAARMLFDDSWGRAQEDNAGRGYRWATTQEARFWLPLDEAEYELTLQLRGARPDQRVRLRVNGRDVSEWTITQEWGEYRARIPRRAVRDGLDELVLVSETTPLTLALPDDRIIGATGVTAAVDIATTGAGFRGGRFGEIFIAGRNVIPDSRGYHLVALDPADGRIVAVGSFDTFADPRASAQLAEFVDKLARGTIVAGAAVDDASQALTDEAAAALGTLGVVGDVRALFRAGHAFVGVKGAELGQAVEDMQILTPANVAIGKNVGAPNVSLALGGIEYAVR